jgi:hypothetical protein
LAEVSANDPEILEYVATLQDIGYEVSLDIDSTLLLTKADTEKLAPVPDRRKHRPHCRRFSSPPFSRRIH